MPAGTTVVALVEAPNDVAVSGCSVGVIVETRRYARGVDTIPLAEIETEVAAPLQPNCGVIFVIAIAGAPSTVYATGSDATQPLGGVAMTS